MRSLSVICLTTTLLLGSAPTAVSATTAPDFTLKDTTGQNIRLSELRGQVVLINFWATWCGPCRKEMPYLSELQDRYRDLGFTVLGVNIDENFDSAKALATSLNVSFPILFDDGKQASRDYRVDAMPASFFVSRDGEVRHVNFGYKKGTEQHYQTKIRELLRE